MKKQHKNVNYAGRILLGILGLLVLTGGGYVIYMQSQYYRIRDHKQLTINNNQPAELAPDKTYTAMTYNMGFGAYNQKYSFFMDHGEMKNGKKTHGKYGTAYSKNAVLKSTDGVIHTFKQNQPDFMLMQEIDTNSTRSFHVNQVDKVKSSFPGYGNVFASNFHSGFIMYPFTNPHGKVRSGLLTLSKYHLQSAVRRKYPITSNFFSKFTDLDRCFTVMTMPVKNGKKLILINSHMSAYDKGGKMRKKQLKLLNHVMAEECRKGNYVIVGGDFNHAFGKKMLTHFENQQKIPSWVSVLDAKTLTSSMRMVHAGNENDVATCRATDIPYRPEVNYETVIDGFLVSKNVEAKSTNVNTEFKYADHNPVKLQFKLK